MYRVDRRIFNNGDDILPPDNSYHDNVDFDEAKKEIERILLEQKPTCKTGDRRTGLFLFSELSDAIRFSCIMTDSKIYKVQPCADTTPFHKGDMNWTEIMSKFTGNEDVLKKLASFYWTDGCKTFKPCWEVLVNKMQVVSTIIGNEEQRKSMCNDFRTGAGLNIENLALYLEKIKDNKTAVNKK